MEGCPRLRQIIILLLFDMSKRFVGCYQLSLFSVHMVFKQIANCFFFLAIKSQMLEIKFMLLVS